MIHSLMVSWPMATPSPDSFSDSNRCRMKYRVVLFLSLSWIALHQSPCSSLLLQIPNRANLPRRIAMLKQSMHARLTTTDGTASTPNSKDVTSSARNDGDQSSSMIRGIIFDIDGTLADTWKLGFDATEMILDKHNIPAITPEHYHECTRYSTPERLARHAGLQPGDPDFEIVGGRLAGEFNDLYVGMVNLETSGFFDGILTLLERIPPSIRLGALTNAAIRYAEAVLTVNGPSPKGVYDRFRSVHGADTVPKPKPSPDGLYQVCRELELPPHQCLYIGDSPTDGIAANAAGTSAIGVTWGSHSRESLVTQGCFSRIVESVSELEQVLLECVVVG